MSSCRASRFVLAFAAAVTSAVFLATPVLTQRAPGRDRGHVRLANGHDAAAGEVLVKYSDARAMAAAAADVEAIADADDAEPIGTRGLRRVHSRSLDPETLVAILRQDPRVEYAEPNYILTAVGQGTVVPQALPNDPYFPYLWGLQNTGQWPEFGNLGADIHAVSAWTVTTGSRANVVAVIDTGIDYTHPDLAANVWSAPSAFSVTIAGATITCPAATHGFNAITRTCDPMDDHGHGTHVSGTIGAVGNNGTGVVGVNWVASIMGAKFLSSRGSGSTSDAINAIEFAIQAKAAFAATGGANVRVLSNSWGGGGFSQALLDEINKANAQDMLFVAAAGNDASNSDLSPSYPSGYDAPNVLAVAATTGTDTRATFSNYGASTVDLGAPGKNIVSTWPGNSYAVESGTSMATPHVSGTAALMLSMYPWSAARLKSILMSTVDPVAALSGLVRSGGRLNAYAAVLTHPSVTVTPTAVVAGANLTATISGATGYPADWIGIFPTAAGDNGTVEWEYLNGTRTPPATAFTNATVTLKAPALTGTYNLRLFANGSATKTATSGTFTVFAPVLTASASVVRAGSGFTVSVSGGPGDPGDWVGLFPLGAADSGYVDWSYLNGTKLIPGAGQTSATVPFTMPADGGTYQVRMFSSNSYTRIATGPTIASAPTLAVGATTVVAGTSITVAITGGPGNQYDWVGLYPIGAAETSWVDWQYLGGSRVVPLSGVRSTTLMFVVPAAGTWEVRFFGSGSYTRTATSATVTATQATLMPSAATVTAGTTFTVDVGGGPGYLLDWVGLYRAGAADGDFVAWEYLSGTHAAPLAGVTSTTLTFALPTSGGSYELRLFANNGFARLATSARIASAPILTTTSAVVAAGETAAVVIVGAPGNATDWVGLYAAGAADNAYGDWAYLNGSRHAPATGLTSASLALQVPATGTYEFRFFSSNSYTRLATSGTVTTVTATVTPTATSVAAGQTFTVAVSDGAALARDWVGLYPAGAADGAWLDWQYLSGSRTPPGSGTSSATLTFTMPSTPGSYEVRLFTDNTYTRLATSVSIDNRPSVTVNSTAPGAGASVTATVTNGPGNVNDWVGLYAADAVDGQWLDWEYLNGTRAAPGSGSSNATLTFVLPAAYGDYNLRLFVNNSYQKIATSKTVHVGPETLAVSAAHVSLGGSLTVTVSNGPANTQDWVGLYPTGAADRSYVDWRYLNGSRTPPVAGSAGGTLTFTMPASAGTYELRFFSNNSYSRLATSPMVTVP